MPEIVHGENALLGSTGEEFAEHVAAVCRDEALRRHIVEGGKRTWEREFRPKVVVDRVVRRIETDIGLAPPSPAAALPTLLHGDQTEVVAHPARVAAGLARDRDLERLGAQQIVLRLCGEQVEVERVPAAP